MTPIEQARAEIASLKADVEELRRAKEVVLRELPIAEQRLEAAQNNLTRLHWRDAKARREARAAELDQLNEQIREARNA